MISRFITFFVVTLGVLFKDGFEAPKVARDSNYFGYYQIGWSSEQAGDLDEVQERIDKVKAHSKIVATNVFPRRNTDDVFDIAIAAGMLVAFSSTSINVRYGRFNEDWREDFETRVVPLIDEYQDHMLMWLGIDEPDLWDIPVSMMDTLYAEWRRWPEIPIFCNFEFMPRYDYLPRECDWVSFTPIYGWGDMEFKTIYEIKSLLQQINAEDGRNRHLAIVGDGWQGWDLERCRYNPDCVPDAEIRRIAEAYNTLHYIYAENADTDGIDVKLYFVYIWKDHGTNNTRGMGVNLDNRLIEVFTDIGSQFPIVPQYEIDYEDRSVLLKGLFYDGLVYIDYLDKYKDTNFWENPSYYEWGIVNSSMTSRGTTVKIPIAAGCDFEDWYSRNPPDPLWRKPCQIRIHAGPFEQIVWVDANRLLSVSLDKVENKK